VPAPRTDGFLFAAEDSALSGAAGLNVSVAGQDYALFRVDGQVQCIDGLCPHAGAPLADGEIKDGVVTCPWHNWTFNICSGCSLDPSGHRVRTHDTLVENGSIYIRPAGVAVAAVGPESP
jgi:nitrite reductase/ring-hydroxylating ferredoxin subunit